MLCGFGLFLLAVLLLAFFLAFFDEGHFLAVAQLIEAAIRADDYRVVQCRALQQFDTLVVGDAGGDQSEPGLVVFHHVENLDVLRLAGTLG